MNLKGMDFETENLRNLKQADYETPMARLQKNAVFDKAGDVPTDAPGEHQIPHTNLAISGFGRDINGNSLVYVSVPGQRRSSIQTNGYLPQTYNAGREGMGFFATADPDKIAKVEQEVLGYIQQFGKPSVKDNLEVYGSKKQASFEVDYLLSTEKEPTVKKGFSSKEEAEKWAKDNDIEARSEDWDIYETPSSTKKQATIFDGFGYRVTIEAKAGDYNESYTPITSMLKSLDIRYREDKRYTVNPDRQMMDILVNKEDIEVIAELNKQSKETGITFTYNEAISEAIQPKTVHVEDSELKQDKPGTE
jgi:hypothetical protein